MKYAMLMGLVLALGMVGCAEDECSSSADCAPFGQACVDSGGILFSGKTCVDLSVRLQEDTGQPQDMGADQGQDLPDLADLPEDMEMGPQDMAPEEMDAELDTPEDIGPIEPDPSQFLTCADTPQPLRCSTEVEWSPASVVTKFELDDDCCFDFNSDGEVDNQLASHAGLGLNGAMDRAIARGEWVLGLEHDGLQDLAMDTYRLNLWQSLYVRNDLLRTPNIEIWLSTIDAGMHPRSYFPLVDVTAGVFESEGGEFDLLLFFEEGEVTVRVVEAKIEGELTDDVDLVRGISAKLRLGGLISAADIADSFSAYVAAECSCLGLTGPWMIWDRDSGLYECAPEGINSCDVDSNCNSLPVCQVFNLTLAPDIDRSSIGMKDHVSMGAVLSAEGAQIVGTTPR